MKVVDIPEGKAKLKMRIQRGNVISEEEQEASLAEFLQAACIGYKPFANGPKNARQYDKIMTILEGVKKEDKQVRFEDADFEVLKAAVTGAEWISPDLGRAYVKAKFYDAVENAQEVKV